MLQHIRHRLNNTTNQIILGFFLAFIFVAVVEAAQWTSGWSTNITTADGVTRVEVKHRRDHLKAKMKGDITWADDDDGIESLGPGAFFEIEERSPGRRRRMEFTRGTDGKPRVAWFVNRKSTAFDEAARAWLRQTLPRLHRRTGFDAERRVARFLAQGGVEAVLQEIALIPGDRVQGVYLQQLLVQASPEEPELAQILDRASHEIQSDFEMARLLEFLSFDRLDQAEVGSSFLGVVETIGSDFALRRILTNMLEGQSLDSPGALILLEASRGIGSDFEMASFLVAFSEAHTQDKPLPSTFADVLSTVGSDFEHRRVVSVVLEQHRDSATLDLVLSVADGIGSDYEQAEFLSAVAASYPLEVPLPPSFFSAIKTVGSDFEHRKVLAATLERPGLDQASLAFVLRSAQNIGSDYELAEILLHLVRRHPLDDGLQSLFKEVLQTIGSDFERQRVEAELPTLATTF